MLGLDTSTTATVAALRLADGRTFEARDDREVGERPRHTTHLLPLSSGLLAEAGMEWGDLESIGVGLGPGTFTGLRVGVATARGLAQALSVPLVGVSSLEALALPALRRAQAVGASIVLAVLDARRGEVFLGAYAGGPEETPVELAAPVALAGRQIGEAVGQLEAGEVWRAVGDGALLIAGQLSEAGVTVADDPELNRVSGAAICELGSRALAAGGSAINGSATSGSTIGGAVSSGPGSSGSATGASAGRGESGFPVEDVLPRYGRRPDAELALKGAGA